MTRLDVNSTSNSGTPTATQTQDTRFMSLADNVPNSTVTFILELLCQSPEACSERKIPTGVNPLNQSTSYLLAIF